VLTVTVACLVGRDGFPLRPGGVPDAVVVETDVRVEGDMVFVRVMVEGRTVVLSLM